MKLRPAFTLMELLVVVAIIAILIALLLPAVQMAREAARRAQCQSHLKQLALSVHSYHDVNGHVPSLYNGEKSINISLTIGLQSHSWRTVVLPYLEEEALHDRLDFSEYATHENNQSAITTTLPVFACPSTPRTTNPVNGLWVGRGTMDDTLFAGTTDYNSSEGYLGNGVCVHGAWGEIDMSGSGLVAEVSVRRVEFADFTDGLSQTLLLSERSALPDHYRLDRVEPHQPPLYQTWGNVGLWAISAETNLNHIFVQEDIPTINGDNQKGLYSFHAAGVEIALSDGSVRFMSEDIDVHTLLSLVTREGGEIIDDGDLR